MRFVALLLTILALCFICFPGYWRVLNEWIQDIRLDINIQSRLRAILKIVALGVYTYLAVQFMKNKIRLL